MLFYRVPSPDTALLLRGWKVEGTRVITGGALVLPPLRRVFEFPLSPEDVEVDCPDHRLREDGRERRGSAFDVQGIELVVHATVSFRVEDVEKASERWASDPERMRDYIENIFGDRLSRVAGTMKVEDIAFKKREEFAAATVTAAEEAMERAGLAVESLAVNVRDKEGYLTDFASPQKTAVAGAALFARMSQDQALYRKIGSLFSGEVPQLPDGRTVQEAAEESLERYAQIAANGEMP